jgi:hypothetical protein
VTVIFSKLSKLWHNLIGKCKRVAQCSQAAQCNPDAQNHLKLRRYLLLAVILLIAASLRWIGLNWDQGFHLHPDERFLTMVCNDSQLPSLANYFNPSRSTLNPHNIGFDFFVYGHLPLTLNKVLAAILKHDNYHSLTLQGRFIAAVADLFVVLIIYKLAQFLSQVYRWKKRRTQQTDEQRGKREQTAEKQTEQKQNASWQLQARPQAWSQAWPAWSALVYALLVVPIQLAHFYAVDPFLNLFMLLSFYFALKYSYQVKTHYLAASSLSFALALSCKITALFVLPLNLWLIVTTDDQRDSNENYNENRQANQQRQEGRSASKFSLHRLKAGPFGQLVGQLFNQVNLLRVSSYLSLAYLGLRCFDPYLFAHASWLRPGLNQQFLKNLQTLQSFSGKEVWYPPAIQWIPTKPVWFAAKNIFLVGLGVIPSLWLLAGGRNLAKRIAKSILNKLTNLDLAGLNFKLLVIFLWMAAYFTYQASQFSKTLRYFLPLYPFFSLIAGWGISHYFSQIKNHSCRLIMAIFNLLLLAVWPLMFISIYLKPHSRVQASHWIYQQLPDQSLILSEHWDDALPLPMAQYDKQFRSHQLPVFGRDTTKKWQTMNQWLQRGDYYILSSNRAWGSISQVPNKYPRMSQFYQRLLAGQTQYQLIARFNSYPSLDYLGIDLTLPDGWAEEAFTVYDHPQVLIFKNQIQQSQIEQTD